MKGVEIQIQFQNIDTHGLTVDGLQRLL